MPTTKEIRKWVGDIIAKSAYSGTGRARKIDAEAIHQLLVLNNFQNTSDKLRHPYTSMGRLVMITGNVLTARVKKTGEMVTASADGAHEIRRFNAPEGKAASQVEFHGS